MKWIKWDLHWLNSSIRDQLNTAERATFHDFVCLAGEAEPPGEFKLASWEALVRKLNTSLDIILSTRDKCLGDRISVRENANHELFVKIENWAKYQSVNPPASKKSQKPTIIASKKSTQTRLDVDKTILDQTPPLHPGAPLSPLNPVAPSAPAASFSDLLNNNGLSTELQAKFPDLDLAEELHKCQLWWNSNHRKVKSPELAYRNWLTKAQSIKAEAGATKEKLRQKKNPQSGYTGMENG